MVCVVCGVGVRRVAHIKRFQAQYLETATGSGCALVDSIATVVLPTTVREFQNQHCVCALAMGTREVYEEKLRTGNLYHEPTIKPGLGTPRCPRCLSSLNSNSDIGEWTITPVLHDATAVAGCGLGGMLSAFYGLNTGMPYIQKHVKGPKWLPFLIGVPPLLMFSAASAAFGGYGLPNFTQLSVTSYYAASSASHYSISLITRYIEDTYTSRSQEHRLQ